MRRCSFRRLPTSADRLDSLFPDTRSSLRLVNAPIPASQHADSLRAVTLGWLSLHCF